MVMLVDGISLGSFRIGFRSLLRKWACFPFRCSIWIIKIMQDRSKGNNINNNTPGI